MVRRIISVIFPVLFSVIIIVSACDNPLDRIIKEDEQRHLDTVPPVITEFALTSENPATSRNITFTLAGSDDVSGVAGWLVNETGAAPDATAGSWLTELPSAYQLSDGDGDKTVYAWAKDGAGNVSEPASFTLVLYTAGPSTSFSLTSATPTGNPAITFDLSGDGNVTGWYISESSDAPDPGGAGWTGTAPSDYTFSAEQGVRTLYAWAKNAGGILSVRRSIQIEIYVAPPTTAIAADSVITGHEKIILTFSETMKNTSESFGGTIGTAVGSWETSVHTDDRLVVSASGLWSSGNDMVLTVDCENQHGVSIDTFSISYDIFNGTCADSSAVPGGDGTVSLPFDAIQDAVDGADSLYVTPANGIDTAEVRVAGGIYATAGPVVTMADGISVLGRWSGDFDTRSTSLYTTTISDTRTSGGGYHNPVAAVLSTVTYSQPTEFSRFTVEIPEVTGEADCAGAGIRMENADSNLTIADITVTNQGNTTYPEWSYGIFLDICSEVAINGCFIEPDDTNQSSFGLLSLDSTAVIHDCEIYGGNAGSSSYAVRTSSSLTITGNSAVDRALIYAGNAAGQSYGIYITSTAAPVIQYVLFDSPSGTAYYLYENSSTSSPAIFSDNYFGTQAGVWYTDNDLGTDVRYNTFSSNNVSIGGVTNKLSFWNNDGVNAQ